MSVTFPRENRLFMSSSADITIQQFENCNALLIAPRHAKTCLCANADCEDHDQPRIIGTVEPNKVYITKTRLFKYIENFTSKNWKFSDKNSDIFHIYAQNIDCGYSLEPPRRDGSNEYPQSMFLCRNKKNNLYPCKPQFYYIKVGF